MRTKDTSRFFDIQNMLFLAFSAYAMLYGISVYASESPTASPVMEEFLLAELRKSQSRTAPIQLARLYQETQGSQYALPQQDNQQALSVSPIGRFELMLMGGILLTIGSLVTPSFWSQRRKRYFTLKWLLSWVHMLDLSVAQRKHLTPPPADDSSNDAIRRSEDNLILPALPHLPAAESTLISLTEAFFQQIGFSRTALSETAFEIVSSLPAYAEYGTFMVYLRTDAPLNQRHIQEIYHETERRYNQVANRMAIVVVTALPETSAHQQIFSYRVQCQLSIILLNRQAIVKSLRQSSCAQQFEKSLNLAIRQRNRYDANTPVVDPLEFFGREETINYLLDAIVHVQPVGIFGVRKIGKTSLMWQLKERLTSHIAVYIDLQHLPKDCAHLYRLILRECVNDASFKYPDMPLPELTYLTNNRVPENPNMTFVQEIQRLWDHLKCRRRDLKIVLLLDEADAFMSRARAHDSSALAMQELLGTLREISQRFEFLAPIFGSTTPDICRLDRRHGRNNPGFHAYKELFLTSLSEETCDRMISGIGAQMGVFYTEESLSRIYYETGGHPYMTRQLCSLITKQIAEKESDSGNQQNNDDVPEHISVVQVHDVETAVTEYLEYKSNYCESLWHRLSVIEQKILSLIARQNSCLLEEIVGEEHETAARRECRKAISGLLENGLIQKCENKYSITMGLFERIILTNN